jgi:hypothetical protein
MVGRSASTSANQKLIYPMIAMLEVELKQNLVTIILFRFKWQMFPSIDVLYPYEVVYSQLGVKEKGPVSFVQRIVNW